MQYVGVKKWLDDFSQDTQDLILEAAKWVDRGQVNCDYEKLFSLIGSGSSLSGKQTLAQFFTPPDVALASAGSLPLPGYVFDPSAGKGSLLISAGIIMAKEHNIRGKELLDRLYGCEICPEIHSELIEIVAQALLPWHDMPQGEAEEILRGNILCEDFLETQRDISQYIILMNPPYKEVKGQNIWMAFLDKILRASPRAVCAILPVSIASSQRAQGLREKIAQYPYIKALHHEIRPRPLFPKVEQRITLLTFDRDRNPAYETTGFLTHRARERGNVWKTDSVVFSYLDPDCLVKVSPDTINFWRSQQQGKSLQDISSDEDSKEDVWIRISGRYSLLAQKKEPDVVTSKWKCLSIGPLAGDRLIQAFSNGDALVWWRMHGDGRDFPLKRFLSTWVVR